MRIRGRKRLFVYGGLAAAVLAFFGYVGYKDLLYDAAGSAESNVMARMAEVESSDTRTPEYYGLKRAEIALAEYRKGVVEAPLGCNCGPEIDKYTGGYHAQWCTMFASWVANEAGSPLHNEKTNFWRIVNSRDFAINLQENGTWYSREEVLEKGLTPRVGDFIVYWRGNFEDNLGHVDVVVELGHNHGTAGMVGGNLNGRVQYRNLSYLQHYGFLGFGRPEKE